MYAFSLVAVMVNDHLLPLFDSHRLFSVNVALFVTYVSGSPNMPSSSSVALSHVCLAQLKS